MPDNRTLFNRRMPAQQFMQHRHQFSVLRLRERAIIATFELDSDRKIVARTAPGEVRLPAMPRAGMRRDKLDELAVALDKQMRGDLHVSNLTEIRMRFAIKTVQKKIPDVIAAKNPGRQANRMNDDQRYFDTCRSRIEIRRRGYSGVDEPAGRRIESFR